MSPHGSFDDGASCGFTRGVDPLSARRQFRVSLGVAVVLALALGTSAFALRPASGYDAASHRTVDSAARAQQVHVSDLRTASPDGV